MEKKTEIMISCCACITCIVLLTFVTLFSLWEYGAFSTKDPITPETEDNPSTETEFEPSTETEFEPSTETEFEPSHNKDLFIEIPDTIKTTYGTNQYKANTLDECMDKITNSKGKFLSGMWQHPHYCWAFSDKTFPTKPYKSVTSFFPKK